MASASALWGEREGYGELRDVTSLSLSHGLKKASILLKGVRKVYDRSRMARFCAAEQNRREAAARHEGEVDR